MAKVLVTDGETRTCLATTRSLGRAGHEVYVTAPGLPALATVSRWCKASAVVPGALHDPDGTAAALGALVARWGVDVVLPTTDLSNLILLRKCGSHLDRAVVAAPDLRAFEAISDKAALLERASRAGLRVPQTVLADDPERLRAAVRTLGLPCVIRPHRSVAVANGLAQSLGVRRIMTERDLDSPVAPAAFPVLVQPYVRGTGEGVFLLMDGGRVLAAFAHRRLREKPPEGGTSVYCESIPLDEDLLRASAQMLAEVGWRGVAMVEFRRSPNGDIFVMEVNGRLWGSLQLAIDAGVDFPALLVSLFLNEPVSGPRSYRIGVRSRWFWGDADHLLARVKRLWRRGSAPPAQLPSFPRFLLDFLAGFLRASDRTDVFEATDPRPFLRETMERLGL